MKPKKLHLTGKVTKYRLYPDMRCGLERRLVSGDQMVSDVSAFLSFEDNPAYTRCLSCVRLAKLDSR